jgi:hypothetical protein
MFSRGGFQLFPRQGSLFSPGGKLALLYCVQICSSVQLRTCGQYRNNTLGVALFPDPVAGLSHRLRLIPVLLGPFLPVLSIHLGYLLVKPIDMQKVC